ncbi:hypothetical protein WHR41_06889 [Cladosporium halotolerans]|uniref:Chromo domain-containing protein n=1 Tax=Cladosporium halotolerans TaxID=1052096 RepID=A0AB34KMW8_9PEZI
MPPPFIEDDSDPDSISIHSTEPSDVEQEYDVEKILAEEPNEDGVMHYLVKWEGYPLHRSSWEPEENLLSDAIMAKWLKEKDAVATGDLEAFDLDRFHEAYEDAEELKDERKRRRAEKRKRLGMTSSSTTASLSDAARDGASIKDAPEGSEDDEPAVSPRQRVKTVITKRKGVAQKVAQRERPRDSSGEEGQTYSDTDSVDSLFGEKRSAATGEPLPSASATSAPKETSLPSASSTSQQQTTPSLSDPTATNNTVPPRVPYTGAARKSAPSTGSQNTQVCYPGPSDAAKAFYAAAFIERKRKAALDPFLKLTSQSRPARKQQDDQGDMRYLSLAEENRPRRLKKEPVPDASVLASVDPNTGTWTPAAGSPVNESPPAAVAEPQRRLSLAEKHDALLGDSAYAASSLKRKSAPAGDSEPQPMQSTSKRNQAARRGSGPASDPELPQVQSTSKRNQTARRDSGPASDPELPQVQSTSKRNQPARRDSGPSRPTATHAPATAAAPKPRTNRKSSQTSTSTGAFHSAYGRREAPAPERQRSPSPPSDNDRRPSSLVGNNQHLAKQNRKTCWDWRNGVCDKANDDCLFAHFYITCPHWQKGNCRNSEAECDYEHRETGHELNASGTGPVTTKPQQQQPRRTSGMSPGEVASPQEAVAANGQSGRRLTMKDIVCPHWKKGRCKFTAYTCKFSHHDTGKEIACPYWLDGYCNRSERNCMYVHRDTGFSTGKSSSGVFSTSGASADLAKGVSAQSTTPVQPRTGSSAFSPRSMSQDVPTVSVVNNNSRRSSKYDQGVVTAGSTVAEVAKGANAQSTPPVQRSTSSSAFGPRGISQDDPTVVHTSTGASPAEGEPRSSTSVSGTPATRPPVFSDKLTLAFDYPTGKFETAVELTCDTKEDCTTLMNTLGSPCRLKLAKVITAAELQKLTSVLEKGATLPSGQISADDAQKGQVEKFAATCKSNVSCGVAQEPSFTLLVVPSGAPEWEFLRSANVTASLKQPLGFKLLPPLPTNSKNDPKAASPDAPHSTTPHESVTSPVDPMELEVDDMLGQHDTRAFVMIPPNPLPEYWHMLKVLKSRKNLKVVQSQDLNDWSKWLDDDHRSALVVIPLEIKLYHIPRLAEVLHKRPAYHVWCAGFNEWLARWERREPKFECQQLFLSGDAVFISDDVILQTPDKALAIIDVVKRMNAGKPRGAARCKVAARPGIRSWLFELVKTMSGEPENEDKRWVSLWEAVDDLCPLELRCKLWPENPSEAADIISVAPESMSPFAELAVKKPDEATDSAVNWFAGWAFMNSDKFRRFTICHQVPGTGTKTVDADFNTVIVGAESDPRKWANEYPYVAVMTPDDWLKEQREKASMKKK